MRHKKRNFVLLIIHDNKGNKVLESLYEMSNVTATNYFIIFLQNVDVVNFSLIFI